MKEKKGLHQEIASNKKQKENMKANRIQTKKKMKTFFCVFMDFFLRQDRLRFNQEKLLRKTKTKSQELETNKSSLNYTVKPCLAMCSTSPQFRFYDERMMI